MQSINVQFPGMSALIPATINGKPVRHLTIDEDGSLIAWACDESPEFDAEIGAWCADTLDMRQAGYLPAQAILTIAA